MMRNLFDEERIVDVLVGRNGAYVQSRAGAGHDVVTAIGQLMRWSNSGGRPEAAAGLEAALVELRLRDPKAALRLLLSHIICLEGQPSYLIDAEAWRDSLQPDVGTDDGRIKLLAAIDERLP